MTLYKVLNEDGSCRNGGSGSWTLGEWKEVEGELVLCENGLHLCDGEEQLLEWLGPAIYEAEYEGERLDGNDKVVVRRARIIRKLDTWNERTVRLFACDCAERVLHLYEEKYSDDKRPRHAIEIARRYVNGEVSKDELYAARAAARAAAMDAAWDATMAAARAAARDAAWDAAAAAAAAWAATRDATMAAAMAAAWAPAWAAAVAAWAAAAAAWAAAAEEQKWQAKRLRYYLNGDE